MTENHPRRIISEAKPALPEALNWREVPKSEMFSRVMVAVDASYAEAEELGDERWMTYLDSQLFPFLEEMKAIAEIHEMMQESEFEEDLKEIVKHHKERSKRGY